MDPLLPFDASLVHDPNAWQPLRYVDTTGATVTPAFVAPHWGLVTPFALVSGSQLRSPGGPARFGSAEYVAQAESVVALSGALTDEQKVIAEYWADGPRSELPPGHWDLFAQFVSRRDHHGANERGVDLDVKLFFALTNAIFDASICCWDNKRAFNSVRPITAIRYLLHGRPIRAWGGPYQGTKTIDGGQWLPYQPSKVEPGAVPAEDVTLTWCTFSEAADQAGISRRYGGIHFEQGDLEARAAGRAVGRKAWERAQQLFAGRS
jgi:hypothetical protein